MKSKISKILRKFVKLNYNSFFLFRGRIGSTASLSSLRWNNDSGSETPRLKPKTSRKKKKSSNKTGSLSKLNNKA